MDSVNFVKFLQKNYPGEYRLFLCQMEASAMLPKDLSGQTVVLIEPGFGGVRGARREIDSYGRSPIVGKYEFLVKKEQGTGHWPIVIETSNPWWKRFLPLHLYMKYSLHQEP